MTEKRFINDIENGQLIDTKGELSTIDYSDKVDFYELWEFLNKLNDENEQLKKDVDKLNDYEQMRLRKNNEIAQYKAREERYQRVIGGLMAYLELRVNTDLWWNWNE